MDGFKAYSHKVYNTDPDWDFNTIWSSAYEGRGYPVLAFQSVLAPNKPAANVTSGTYTSAFNVTLTSSGSSSIRYTINGGLPTCSTGTLYTTPIPVSSNTVIKAVGCDTDNLASVLGEFSYVISASTPRTITRTTSLVDTITEEDTTEEKEPNTPVTTTGKDVDTEDTDIDVNEKETKKFEWWWILVAVGGITMIYVIYRRNRGEK
jgi:hypothetical protein